MHKNMSSFNEFFNEQLKDPKFKKEWDDIQSEIDMIRGMIEEKNFQNITEKEFTV